MRTNDAEKVAARYNNFKGNDKSYYFLKGTATSLPGNKGRAASDYILYKDGLYIKVDYSKEAQSTWDKAYDKIVNNKPEEKPAEKKKP